MESVLASIVADGRLRCDAEIARTGAPGTTIGMNDIKRRRLTKTLNSHPGLYVGDCVPFYFCPRSIMLYVIYMGNHPELEYRGGQNPIIHLEGDLRQSVAWADDNQRRWAFTSSNAGSAYFEDYSDLTQLDELDWAAVRANQWAGVRAFPKLAHYGRAYASTHLDSRLRGNDGMRFSGQWKGPGRVYGSMASRRNS